MHPVQDIEAKIAAVKAGLLDRDTVIEELAYDPELVDMNQARAMLRARAYGLNYDTHVTPEGGEVKTELGERISELEQNDIRRAVEKMEQAEKDRGALELGH